jgi:ABC-2 type transport system permease protein
MWWPLLVPLAATPVLVGVAVLLADRRDFGGGLLPTPPGPDRAPGSLRGPLGLAWRMQRGALLAWAVALAACGVLVGTLGPSMQDMIRDNPDLAAYIAVVEGGSIIDAYQATFVLIMTLVVGGFAVWSAGRLVPEEADGRLELVLAGPLARARSLAADLLVTAACVSVLLVVSGASAGLTYAVVADDLDQGIRVTLAPLVYLPAILVLIGVVVVTFGWAPHWTWVGWLVLAFETVLGWLGGLLKPPAWMFELSLFDRAPRYPLEPMTWAPLLALLAAALVLLAVGWSGFRRRDIV